MEIPLESIASTQKSYKIGLRSKQMMAKHLEDFTPFS